MKLSYVLMIWILFLPGLMMGSLTDFFEKCGWRKSQQSSEINLKNNPLQRDDKTVELGLEFCDEKDDPISQHYNKLNQVKKQQGLLKSCVDFVCCRKQDLDDYATLSSEDDFDENGESMKCTCPSFSWCCSRKK